jgi:PhzF family phenazine biosynthesis protein
MKTRPFKQVDVFTATPYRGNPLAVVLDAAGLTSAEMQSFTDWTNLSEATFILPPEDPSADYKVRIFCPGRELPFAGHPTLGSCHAWLEGAAGTALPGGKPKGEYIVQECGVGLVKIRRDGNRLAFMAPPLKKSGPLTEADVELIAHGLGVSRSDIIHHAWCDNGPNWRGVMLASAEQVLALKPDAQVLAGLDVGVVGPCGKVGVVAAMSDGDAQFEIRAFFTVKSGIAEDPVTGSLNAAVAQWLIGAGLAPKQYIASQGTALGRAGRVHVLQEGDDIWIGGSAVTCIEGTVLL